MPVRVLLVDVNRDSETEQVLRSAGHLVMRAFGFQEAKRWLQSVPPDLLMTDVRLGAYNGLHLVIRAHADHPWMPAIVLDTDHDPVLEREANGAGATYVARSFEPTLLQQHLVERASNAMGDRDCSPRYKKTAQSLTLLRGIDELSPLGHRGP